MRREGKGGGWVGELILREGGLRGWVVTVVSLACDGGGGG